MNNPADMNDAVFFGLKKLANAITPTSAIAGKDAAGGTVESLTEAVMGVTAGLFHIAAAISELAEAVRERNE